MTIQTTEGDAVYVMGRSDHEARRLELQGGLCNGWTRQLFARAGLGPGMQVLAVGSATGAVARLAILETACADAAADGLSSVTFTAPG